MSKGKTAMGVLGLGYIGVGVSDPAAWRRFAVDVLGLMPADDRAPPRRYRLDSQQWRIHVEPDGSDDIAFAGFEVADAEGLAAVAARLEQGGVAIERGTATLIADREVTDMLVCHDPEGLRVEIYYGPLQVPNAPFVSPAGVSGFVTGKQGLGHIVLSAPALAATRHFYSGLLGFRLSDHVRVSLGNMGSLDLEFYHCNPRHHTLALVPAPTPKRLHHFMLQTLSMDDVGLALDRAFAGAEVVQSIGRHTNDHMISFYVRTPSGFDVEFGHGARVVDEANWRVGNYDRPSSWGHRRIAGAAGQH
jgi:2,3-dihydroxybiphenyl 1,2-dioxygenase